MFPEDKLNVIREYLRSEFETENIDDKHDFDREAQTFRIDADRLYLITVAREFIDDNDSAEITRGKNLFFDPKNRQVPRTTKIHERFEPILFFHP